MKAGTYELNTSKDSKELIDILKESPEDVCSATSGIGDAHGAVDKALDLHVDVYKRQL